MAPWSVREESLLIETRIRFLEQTWNYVAEYMDTQIVNFEHNGEGCRLKFKELMSGWDDAKVTILQHGIARALINERNVNLTRISQRVNLPVIRCVYKGRVMGWLGLLGQPLFDVLDGLENWEEDEQSDELAEEEEDDDDYDPSDDAYDPSGDDYTSDDSEAADDANDEGEAADDGDDGGN